jgi:hypothetical protein
VLVNYLMENGGEEKHQELEKYIPYQCPSPRPNGGDAIERAQRLRSQRRGGFHPELEGWPGSWDQQRRCLYPRYLRVTVSKSLSLGGGGEEEDEETH